jgi:hypothetical protein
MATPRAQTLLYLHLYEQTTRNHVATLFQVNALCIETPRAMEKDTSMNDIVIS